MEQLTQAKANTPPQKELSPRERAEIRAKELLGGGFDANDSASGSDDFYVDLDTIPDGWTYEWKRYQTLGMDLDSHHIHLRKQGWEAVPRLRHPDMMPVGDTSASIIRKGMILMERPAVITEQVRRAQDREARDRVRSKEEQLRSVPLGKLDPEGRMGAHAKIGKSYEAMAIPDE